MLLPIVSKYRTFFALGNHYDKKNAENAKKATFEYQKWLLEYEDSFILRFPTTQLRR